ncbi:hypothetical protein DRJ22_04370, partial [Candidatus Woesearchaeota archaeon]
MKDVVELNFKLLENNEKEMLNPVKTLKDSAGKVKFLYEKETGKIIKLTGSRSKLAKNKEQGIGFFEITLKLNLKEA